MSKFRTSESGIDGMSKPGSIHYRIVEVMKRFPEGISGGQIREELERVARRIPGNKDFGTPALEGATPTYFP